MCRYRHEGYGGRRPVRARSADGRRSRDLMTAPFDMSKPNIARMYDYRLGGKDHFEADHEQDRPPTANVAGAAPRAIPTPIKPIVTEPPGAMVAS